MNARSARDDERVDVFDRDTRLAGGDAETVFDLLQANVRPLFGKGRILAQALDQELLRWVDQRVINGGTAQVHSSHDLHASFSVMVSTSPNFQD